MNEFKAAWVKINSTFFSKMEICFIVIIVIILKNGR